MRRSTSRTLFALALAASVGFSLRPDRRVERLAQVAFTPSRWLAESCAPLRWLRVRSARAAQSSLIEREPAEHGARQELQRLQREATEPSSPTLRADRRFVHGEVVDRNSQLFDALVVRLDGLETQGLAVGMPAIHGEDFIGRVARFDARRPGHAIIELITSREFAVGARLDALDERGEPLRCVVGGLAPHSRLGADLRLALAAPSSRDLPAALARVDEGLSALAPFSAQSAGFRLGRVEAAPTGDYVVVPALDLRTGPFHISIVAPASIERSIALEPYEPLSDANWAAARVLTRCVGRREGFGLSSGTLDGVASGAAFVVGSRLVGRVLETGPARCAVASLADPGWVLPAVALPAPGRAPIPLGSLVGLGRTSDGALEFEWRSAGLLGDEEGPLEVRVFTGSGAAGIPSGLWIGEARLAREPGIHRLRIEQGVDLRSLQRGFVRRREPEL